MLSSSKHDMLRTYKFVRYPEPEDMRLCRLPRAWDMLRARALDILAGMLWIVRLLAFEM